MTLVAAGMAHAAGAVNGASCAVPSDCNSGFCVDNFCCNAACSGGACDACSLALGASANGVCTILPSSVECRPQVGECDVAEFCDGSTAACPSDVVIDAGIICRSPVDVCDVAESCNGSSGLCPVDAVATSAVVCRSASDDCDAEETCDGASVACPFDELSAPGTLCRPSVSTCDAEERCSGADAACPSDEVSPQGTLCRAAMSICDEAETCDGASTACPTDGFVASGMVCRAPSGVCDVAETCTGASGACPADGFADSTRVCRGAAGDCDVEETCDGSGTQCPDDSFSPSTVTCRFSFGACDQDETCTGSSAACPANQLSPMGTVCRAAMGPCDLEETCSGMSVSCPSNTFKSSGTVCRTASGACDLAEACDGSSPTCPNDAVRAAGFACRASASACDAPESCDGASTTCPTDLAKPAGTSCRASTALCDVAEVCDGTALACPGDGGSMERSTVLHDANLVAAVGAQYRYNVSGRIGLDGPKATVTYKRCDGAVLPSGFNVDAQTGLVLWTPTAPGPTDLCVAIEGGCGSDRYEFTVEVAASAPPAPSARFMFAPPTPAIQERVTFDASGSTADPGSALYAFDWELGDGTIANGLSPAHAFAGGGAYTTRLTTTDAYGSLGLFYDIVPVLDPYCDALPRVVITTNPLVQFGKGQLTQACDCQDVRYYAWALGDGTTSDEASPTHEYGPGRYQIKLVGSRAPGCIGQDAVYLEVRSAEGLRPPVCSASVSIAGGRVPLDVTFSGLWADPNPDGAVTSAVWTLDNDDKTTSSDPTFDVRFEKPGTYHANLIVTGAGGLTCQTSVEVNALSVSGDSYPRFLSKPGAVAKCGQAYHYDEETQDTPTVRGRSMAARFSLGQSSLDGTVDGLVEGMTVDSRTGRVDWTPPLGKAGKQRVVLAFQNGAGRALQDYEVDVACDGVDTGNDGCSVGSVSSPGAWFTVCCVLGALWLARGRRRRSSIALRSSE